jgi:hypothetical protein
MMLVVMDFHRLGIDVRFEGIGWIGQRRKLIGHDYFLLNRCKSRDALYLRTAPESKMNDAWIASGTACAAYPIECVLTITRCRITGQRMDATNG